ncbi:hypothetical protein [Glaciimonas sp. PAMC28666]|uniref:hypothetical protein n=1 Tax=Glaciimonas sp. PAMC28666 TaxID=2807626 RepID=UPI001964E887|nr:hypothetical protein [Glaciimonas sp. PAMC28666]QRX83220.1 hypothetical protein JQN73_02760 [Glaciimonas sp. PAMC28666]
MHAPNTVRGMTMICHQCKAHNLATDLTCTQCHSNLAGNAAQSTSASVKKTAPQGRSYYGQIASWVVICVFVLLYKAVLPRLIESPLWENSTVFGIGVALSWIAGRLIGKVIAQKKAI